MKTDSAFDSGAELLNTGGSPVNDLCVYATVKKFYVEFILG